MRSAPVRPALRLAAVTAVPRRSGAGVRQMSPVNPFEGRGRGAGAVRYRHLPLAPVARDAAREAWSRAMRAVFRSREACAAEMDVTFQTACNWFDAFSTPTGDKVIQFSRDYPDAYAAVLREVAA